MKKILELIRNIRFKYLLHGSIVIVDSKSKMTIGKGCTVSHSKIVLKSGNCLHIGEGCVINHSVISSVRDRDMPITAYIDSHNTFDHVSMLIEDDVRIGGGNTFSNVENYGPIEITVGGPLTIGG